MTSKKYSSSSSARFVLSSPWSFYEKTTRIKSRPIAADTALHWRVLLGVLTVFFLATFSAQAQPTIEYQWNAASWLASYSTNQFSASAITNPDGTEGAQIEVLSTSNPYNYIFVHNAGLQGGHQYTAVITFSIAAPITYPSSIILFARNSQGTQYDISQQSAGLPGSTRKIVLPLDLPNIGGTWELYFGIGYGGTINLNSAVVYSGLTSDGVNAYTRVAPTFNGTPTSTLPSGFVSATGYTAFSISAPASPVTTVSLVNDPNFVADYAGAPISVAQENAAELQSKINSLPKGQACELLLPSGTYRLALNSTLSPTTSGGFSFSALTNLTVNGQGAVLVMENLTSGGEAAFTIASCSKTVFENFSLDWDWNTAPIASLATVSNITDGGYQADFTFSTGTTTPFSAAQMASIQNTPWTQIFQMNPTHVVRNNAVIYTPPSNPTITTVAGQTNELQATFPTSGGVPPLVSGSTYCIRYYYYNMGAFKVASCSNFEFSGVNIYSMPGMGWLFEDQMQNFGLYNCQILRTIPSSYSNNYPASYPLTTAADGVHSDGSLGNLLIESCNLTGTGDDAMNLHDDCYQDDVVTNSSTSITLENCSSYTLNNLNNGDPIEFYNEDFSYLGKGTVPVTLPLASFTTNNGGNPPTVTLNFTSPLPAGLTTQSIIRDSLYETSNVRISGNNINYTNGRGILFSGDNATISSNFIRGVYSAPLVLETEIVQLLWAEGHGATNLEIESNTLEDCNQQGRYDGAYIYSDILIPWGQTTATLFNKVSITNNVFYDCPGAAVSLTNSENVLVDSNSIRLGTTPANLNVYAGSLLFSNSSELALGGNTWDNLEASSSAYGVIYDPSTTSEVSPNLNALVNSY